MPPAASPPTDARSRYERRFFLGMACLFPVLAALGFAPNYVADFTGQIKLHWFAHVHGALMTGWLVVFLVQSLLAMKGQLRYHRQLGILAAGLGVLIWFSLIAALIRALREFPPPLENDTWDIFTMSLALILLFGVFFGAGIAQRKKNPAAHKRLLLLATLVLMQAAVDRIAWLPGLNAVYWVRFIYLDLLLLPLFVYDWVALKRLERTTVLGSGFLIMLQLVVTPCIGSLAVHQFWIDRLTPFMAMPVAVKLTDAQSEPLLGEYGWEKWHMSVVRKDGRLYLQMPDQEPFEFLAASETEFFMRKMLWTLSFPRDANGKVIKIVNRQPRIKDWEAPKK